MTGTTKTTSKIVASLLKWMKRVAPAGLLSFHLKVEPAPASRPRVGRYGTYYLKTYQNFRNSAKEVTDALDAIPSDKPIVLLIEAVVSRPKNGKLDYPQGDYDNFAKGPGDAFNKVFWKDDNQIVGGMCFKRYTLPGEEPGFRLHWFELEED